MSGASGPAALAAPRTVHGALGAMVGIFRLTPPKTIPLIQLFRRPVDFTGEYVNPWASHLARDGIR